VGEEHTKEEGPCTGEDCVREKMAHTKGGNAEARTGEEVRCVQVGGGAWDQIDSTGVF
jgi:hypothetical protein